MLIAQTSDLHIRPPGMLVGGVVDTAAALEACVAHLQALAHRPDLLLITGDLTQQGRPEEYAHLRRLLAPLDLPLLVCPGNHDDRAALRAGLDGLCPWPEPPGAGIPDGATLDLTFDLGPLRLIGLDSLRSGHSGGALSASQEAWLDSALSEAAFLDKPVVLFLHHPPFPMGIDHLDAARLDQSETLGLLLDRHPGRVVRLLCGHAHRHVTTVWHGVAVTVCPAPAFAFALDFAHKAPAAITLEPPALLLHRWDGRARLLVTHVSPIGAGERRSYGGERPTVGV